MTSAARDLFYQPRVHVLSGTVLFSILLMLDLCVGLLSGTTIVGRCVLLQSALKHAVVVIMPAADRAFHFERWKEDTILSFKDPWLRYN